MDPILVVGAGPVGLLLAGELYRHGVPCRIVDAGGHRNLPRAIAVHARTLEIFASLGLFAEALERGKPCRAIHLHDGRAPLARIDLGAVDSPLSLALCLPQHQTEAILEAHLERLGGRVERGVRLVDLQQDPASVTVTLEDHRARTTERFAWVVGCDGARSATRQLLGVPFEGTDIPGFYAVGAFQVEGPIDTSAAHVFFAPEGPLAMLPLPAPGAMRVALDLPDLEQPHALDLPFFQDLIDTRGPRGTRLSEPRDISALRMQQRIVPRFRHGRVFLAGDAAHVHAPLGGQGMNTGLQDAHNLAFRLALAARGVAADGLLDAYDAERRPVAEALLRGVEASQLWAGLRHPAARTLRDGAIRFLSRFEGVRRRAAEGIAEVAVGYPESPWVGEDIDAPLEGPSPGERAPDAPLPGGACLHDLLRDPRHALLLLCRPGDAEGRERMSRIAATIGHRFDRHIAVHAFEGGELGQRYGGGRSCLYLIRPDGHIGFRAAPPRLEGLSAHLRKVFRVV
jgi:2-polyprenyl-6-methoxyphenol hydroxylase-like FAD-dependent oxidoreductase